MKMMKNILVVDDNKRITDVMQLILKSSGYDCAVANSAEECLDAMRSNRFDLILLDLTMPRVSGIDVLMKVKEDPVLSHNRIVFCTASALTDDRIADLKKQGVLDFIRKPATKAEMLEVIGKCAK